MAKCPRCVSRKGKRYCPALRESICPQCCAEERLKTIACPQDCEHLSGELYQHKRRKERAFSQGRELVEMNSMLFVSRQARDFAFKIEADVYFFSHANGPVSDQAIADVFDALKGRSSTIIVPERSPHPVFGFLAERLGDAKRYPLEPGFGASERTKALGTLASHIRSLAKGSKSGEPSLVQHAMIARFFDALDFEADLDYSPNDARSADAPRGEHRTPSGLILP